MRCGFSVVLFLLFGRFVHAQTEPVKLQWMQIPYATSYEIEVESSGTKGRPLITRTVAIPELAVDLPPGSYVYRVRGLAAKGQGPWSEKQPFEVKPETIALLTPANDFKAEAGSRVRFSWKGASGYRYHIQISDTKGVVSDRELQDPFFQWTAPITAGAFRWRVTYSNVAGATWSEQRTVAVQPAPRNSPAAIAANKIERPHSRWAKTLWAGASMNSYAGDFADTANNVTASTLSGDYAFEIERKHERFSPFSEPRPEATIGVRQQSLVKKTAWLPDVALGYTHLWTLGYVKIGPVLNAGYGKSGLFTADAKGTYNTDSFWRSRYTGGIYSEILFSQIVLSPFAKVGSASSGKSSLAAGGVKPSSIMEAGIGGKLGSSSKWTLQVRYFKEDVKWTSSFGNNTLSSNNWSIDLGGEL